MARRRAPQCSFFFFAMLVASLLLSLTACCCDAYQFPSSFPRRSFMTMKRGGRRGGFDKDLASSPSPSKPMGSGGGGGSGGGVNWIPLNTPASQVSNQQDGTVTFVETNLITLKDGAANPNGAVSVLKYKGQTYCFDSTCPCCKIPLTKSKVVETEDGPQLVCDFCKTKYSLKDGAKLGKEEGGGIFSGLVKTVFSAQESGPLNMYKLGEKDGKLLIALD